jgi:methionyl-tRNA formyltransferase
LRLVFAGTSAFGVPSLRALHASRHEVSLVITQPDRRAGRKKELAPPPIKLLAASLNFPLIQPERINSPEAHAALTAADPDVLVVISYGQILKPKTLSIPRLCTLNVHASLLPRHRGASPIQTAILSGDAETGVTIMVMDEGLDTGPILLSTPTPILPSDTAGSLHDRLAKLGAPLLLRALDGLETKTLQPTPQDASEATQTRLLTKDDGLIDWHLPAVDIERKIRAFTPWPSAFTDLTIRGRPRRLIIESATLEPEPSPPAGPRQPLATASGEPSNVAPASPSPGTVLESSGDRLVVATGSVPLRLTSLRPAGRPSMSAAAFLCGA